jgi:hypothetical protein
MPRWTRCAAALTASSILLLGCGGSDGNTGSDDADADTQIEGDRDTVECTNTDEAATGETIEEDGADPQGSTEASSGDECATTEGDTGEGGDGETNSGGAPGIGTPSDDSSDSSGGSDTGTG